MKILEIDSTRDFFKKVFETSFTKPEYNHVRNGIYAYFYLNDDARSVIGNYKLVQLNKFFDGRESDYIIIGLILNEDQAMRFMLTYDKVPCEDYNPTIHLEYIYKSSIF